VLAGDYRANHCHEASHCIPCWVRYASCLGREDGLNPWPELEWKPFFVECYRQRTVFQGKNYMYRTFRWVVQAFANVLAKAES
jgi:hypothetical protein